METPKVENQAVQNVCIYCGIEHYGINVYAISRGECPCHECGKTPPKMTESEYQTKLIQMKRNPKTLNR